MIPDLKFLKGTIGYSGGLPMDGRCEIEAAFASRPLSPPQAWGWAADNAPTNRDLADKHGST
ncbi:hypothetical protein BH09PSE3_BH09PSE3_19330 [soil metagenome]